MAVLARAGVDGATLGRIAEEAGTGKRMITYYYGSREGLLAAVVRGFATDMRGRVLDAIADVSGPADLVDLGVNALWEVTTERPELLRAYLALTAHHNCSRALLEAMHEVTETFEWLFASRAELMTDHGFRLVDRPAAFVTVMFAGLRGLLLEWAERGETSDLRDARELYKTIVTGRFVPI